MQLTPVNQQGRLAIHGYGPGTFRVAGKVLRGPLLVFPDRTVTWAVSGFEDIVIDSLAAVVEAEPRVEVLLLGCGEHMKLPPAALRLALKQTGIVLEAMDTGAACRTYNVLLAEDRRVAAALLPL